MLWKALGAFLDERTLAKIHVRILKTQLHFPSQAARIKCLFQLQVLGNNYQSNLLEVIDQRCKSMQLIFGIFINYCSESIVSFGYECFFHMLAPLSRLPISSTVLCQVFWEVTAHVLIMVAACLAMKDLGRTLKF